MCLSFKLNTVGDGRARNKVNQNVLARNFDVMTKYMTIIRHVIRSSKIINAINAKLFTCKSFSLLL